MGFWGWAGLFFAAAVIWYLFRDFMGVNDAEKSEIESAAIVKKAEDIASEIVGLRLKMIHDLNVAWGESCIAYHEALKSGDKFLATSKGRIFYALHRELLKQHSQSHVITDEIRIKNEVSKGSPRPIKSPQLEDFTDDELKDQLLVS